MDKKKELQEEKDFITLRASNYHYDLGVEHENERIKELINKNPDTDDMGISRTAIEFKEEILQLLN